METIARKGWNGGANKDCDYPFEDLPNDYDHCITNSGSGSLFDTGSGNVSSNSSQSPTMARMLEIASNGIGQVSPIGGNTYRNSASTPNSSLIHPNANQREQMMGTYINDSRGHLISSAARSLPKDHHSNPGLHLNHPIPFHGNSRNRAFSPMKNNKNGVYTGQPELLAPQCSTIGLNSMYVSVNSAKNHAKSSFGSLPLPPDSLSDDIGSSLGIPSSTGDGVPLDCRACKSW